jgi:hypothetical protein
MCQWGCLNIKIKRNLWLKNMLKYWECCMALNKKPVTEESIEILGMLSGTEQEACG